MIRTERLVLRPIEDRDHEPLMAMLTDPVAMRNLIRHPTRETARGSIERHIGYRTSHGLGFWVIEQDAVVAGLCGLKPGALDTPIAGEMEIGWLLATRFWGRGLATEAARASLDWAWVNTCAARVVAITAASHQKSQEVMVRLGMARLPEGDFEHPLHGVGDPLRQSVTFAIGRPRSAK